jgi:hypothetical protein
METTQLDGSGPLMIELKSAIKAGEALLRLQLEANKIENF